MTEGSRTEYRAITIYRIVPCNFKSYHVIDLLPRDKLNFSIMFYSFLGDIFSSILTFKTDT